MQINSNSIYDIGFKYSIKLNEKETLIVEEDPASRAQADAQKAENERKNELKKIEETNKENNPQELSESEKQLVDDLAARDAEVRGHEATHQSVGAGITGGASYTYQQGPDGKMYAIGGEVSVSMPTGGTPEETIQNAKKLAAAALAVGSPSPQDISVASSAKMMEVKARQEMSREEQNKSMGQDLYKNSSLSQNSKDDESKRQQGLDISA